MLFRVIASLIICAFAFATTASAQIVEIKSTGTLVEGYDEVGIFGAAETSLTGDTYSLVGYLDLSKGQLASVLSQEISYTNDYGGSSNNLPSLGSATLTVNGKYYKFLGDSSSDDQAEDAGPDFGSLSEIQQNWFELDSTLHLTASNQDGVLPFSIFTPPSGNIALSNKVFGSWVIFSPQDGENMADGLLSMNTYEVSIISSIPEPATWASMLMGLTLLGCAIRQRRHAQPGY